jgi:hypothetical protein
MKARDVVGKKIVGINQQRFYNRNTGRSEVGLDSIILDDGTTIIVGAAESHFEPFVWCDAVKTKKGAKPR